MSNKNDMHSFGGKWTVEKLDIFSDYLNFYAKALKGQPFNLLYIDAFAGTGYVETKDGQDKIEGSASIALNAQNKFDKYYFIEKNMKHFAELTEIIDTQYLSFKKKVVTINGDCNVELEKLCKSIDWKSNRALLLLDPYATELTWETLTLIAKTKAIDVWYLFPLSAVQRLLPRKGVAIDPTWRLKLNAIFGDDSWEQEFYKENPQLSFLDEPDVIKVGNTDSIAAYLCKRLETIFAKVAKNPRILYNSKNSPLFLFCFAVSNDKPKAIGLAMRGANWILNNK